MNRNHFNRRQFLMSNLVAGAAIMTGQSLTTQNQNPSVLLSKPYICKDNKRKLGKLEVSSQGLGGLPVVGFYGGGVREQSHVNKLYQTAYENGITFLIPQGLRSLTNETQIGSSGSIQKTSGHSHQIWL